MEDFVFRVRPWAITLVLHNWPLMVCSAFILWAAIRAYQQPTRPTLLRLYGAVMLAVAFEYQKHGIPIAQETLAYLFSSQFNPGARYVSYLIFLEILPIELYLLGFLLLAISLVRDKPARLRRVPMRTSHGPVARRGRGT